MVDRIHSKAIYTSVEPEFQHLAHGPLHVGIAPIEVRLLLQICVVVVLPGGLIETPRRSAKLALPVVWRRTVRFRVSPDVPVSSRMELRGATLLKPGMLIGRMVRNKIEDDLNATRVRSLKERIEVC